LLTIENFVREGSPIALRSVGIEKQRNMLEEYVDHLLTLVDVKRIRPLKIVVDAGNGMAGHTAPAIFARLNCEVIPMYFELDGSFPNHEANPLDESTLTDLKQAIIDHNADLGLAFDGDADRCFLVDERGIAVNPSALTALIAQRELKKRPGSKIIYNLISSRAVKEVIDENGGTGLRSRVGHSYIKKMMAESGAIFGGEHSGHFYFKEFWMADSGALAALHAIAALGEGSSTMSELLAPFNRYYSSGEINSKVADTQQATNLVRKSYDSKEYQIDEVDGLTVNADTWWFNLRPSNTEPLLRLNVEASTQAQMESVRDAVLSLIRG
jgi:phosphomannomutase